MKKTNRAVTGKHARKKASGRKGHWGRTKGEGATSASGGASAWRLNRMARRYPGGNPCADSPVKRIDLVTGEVTYDKPTRKR